VTEILAAVGLTRDYRHTDERYSQIGRAAHQAVAWHAEGVLDEATIHPDVRPGLDAYLEFVEQAHHIPLVLSESPRMLASELEMVHPGLGCVAHLDRVGSLGEVETALIDWKYSDSPDLKGARYQLAGYRLIWDYLYPEQPIQACVVVQLKKDGTPRVHHLTDDYAMQVFTAALIVERAKGRSS
jgi:hypothetical protein